MSHITNEIFVEVDGYDWTTRTKEESDPESCLKQDMLQKYMPNMYYLVDEVEGDFGVVPIDNTIWDITTGPDHPHFKTQKSREERDNQLNARLTPEYKQGLVRTLVGLIPLIEDYETKQQLLDEEEKKLEAKLNAPNYDEKHREKDEAVVTPIRAARYRALIKRNKFVKMDLTSLDSVYRTRDLVILADFMGSTKLVDVLKIQLRRLRTECEEEDLCKLFNTRPPTEKERKAFEEKMPWVKELANRYRTVQV